MMPYIQGISDSIPDIYKAYKDIVDSLYLKKGDIGFLTIDESLTVAGTAHRGYRAKYSRALHTEAGKVSGTYCWGGIANGLSESTIKGASLSSKHKLKPSPRVTLKRDVKILLANSIDNTCALWNTEHEDTTNDGDIGHVADHYPLDSAILMKAGEVHKIGILTPHESLPVETNLKRQFLRIISSGVSGREHYFTCNPLVAFG